MGSGPSATDRLRRGPDGEILRNKDGSPKRMPGPAKKSSRSAPDAKKESEKGAPKSDPPPFGSDRRNKHGETEAEFLRRVAPTPELSSSLANGFRGVFHILAGRLGDHYELTETEAANLGRAWGMVLMKYGLPWEYLPEILAIGATVPIAFRIRRDMLIAVKAKEKSKK